MRTFIVLMLIILNISIPVQARGQQRLFLN